MLRVRWVRLRLGPIWFLEHIIILVAAVLLARWVWRYLTKRLMSQLLLIITSLTFAVVLMATSSVSGLLLGSVQHDSLSSLETASKVLDYAIDSKTADTRTNAEVLAKDSAVTAATITRNKAALASAASAILVEKHLTEAVITDEAGLVLARGSDPERAGDSFSNNPVVTAALGGTSASSITTKAGAIAPSLVITTASPIKSGGQIIGTATASLALDDAFVDGLKRTTSLDSTIYSGSTRAATTLTAPNGTSRAIGTKETNQKILDQVLKKGKIWQGVTSISGQPYLSVYLPLKDVKNNPVGMLFVGQSQNTVLSSAQNAVKLAFAGAAIALLVITLPVFIIAGQISRQLR